MIKATSYVVEKYTEGEKKREVIAQLVADDANEVKAQGTSGKGIIGLGENDTLTFGSFCLCVDGSSGMLGSNGQWNI